MEILKNLLFIDIINYKFYPVIRSGLIPKIKNKAISVKIVARPSIKNPT